MTASKLFLPSVLLASAVGLQAAAPKTDDVLARMKKAESDILTLSFRFTQTADITLTGEKQKISGSAAFRKPDKFRIEHLSPQAQTVVSDGKTLWFYNPARNQVLVDSWANWTRSAGFPKGLLPYQTATDDLRERYDIVCESEVREKKRTGAVLRLTPKESGPWTYTFRLWVDLDTGVPYRTELQTQGVNSVTDVTDVRVNPPLKESVFVFDVPKDAEILGGVPGQ
ncbi:MAG TPA: outer membrane lipoprotein carrier protein LolA [Elusimicrobiota bacterium]|nr:outer membrane lipoprotein carrier protein LolA [Elusimicrobiota bacterium]